MESQSVAKKEVAIPPSAVDLAIAELRGSGFWRASTSKALIKLALQLSDFGLTDEAVAHVLRESWSIVSNEYGE